MTDREKYGVECTRASRPWKFPVFSNTPGDQLEMVSKYIVFSDGTVRKVDPWRSLYVRSRYWVG